MRQLGVGEMMQEENRDYNVEAAIRTGCLLEMHVADAEGRGVGARLPDRRWREIDSRHFAHMRRQQQFRIANPAAQAEHPGLFARAR